MEKIAGVDIGNDSVKVILGDQQEPVIIPNVIVPGYERRILQEEDSPLEALDVTINSAALSDEKRRYFVGHLAVEDEDNFELEEADNKAESGQPLIVTLTTLAYAALIQAVQYNPSSEDEYEVDYIIGTGLPVRLFARYQHVLEERLIGEHEVTFNTTPKLRGKRVKLRIKKAFVFIEGAAAIYNMSTDQSLSMEDRHIFDGCIGVCEIGALTTDLPVIKNMNIDNRFSYGEQMGLANYLDSIMRDVEDQHGYTFPSRAKLVERIKYGQYTVQKIGEGQGDIRPIVDQYFTRAAQRMVDLIKKRWKKCPDIQCFYVLGGGGAALKNYMIDAAGSMKLRFVMDSELQNMYGYLKLVKRKMEILS